jgi:hypothetical protein
MAREDFHHDIDSMKRVERLFAIEEALIQRIRSDHSLSSAQRDELIREVEARAESGDFPEGDDWDDDDALAILVRRLGPKGPQGKLGAALRPETDLEH